MHLSKSRFAAGVLTIALIVGFGASTAEAEDLKTFIRAVSSGTLSVDELGDLTPYFGKFRPIKTYEDGDVFLSLGENKDHELVLFAWAKGKRSLTLNQATERWAEEQLGSVTTEEDMKAWKDFRTLLRGAIHSVSEEGRPLQAAAFVGDYALVGDVDINASIQTSPVAFRFVKKARAGEFLL